MATHGTPGSSVLGTPILCGVTSVRGKIQIMISDTTLGWPKGIPGVELPGHRQGFLKYGSHWIR